MSSSSGSSLSSSSPGGAGSSEAVGGSVLAASSGVAITSGSLTAGSTGLPLMRSTPKNPTSATTRPIGAAAFHIEDMRPTCLGRL